MRERSQRLIAAVTALAFFLELALPPAAFARPVALPAGSSASQPASQSGGQESPQNSCANDPHLCPDLDPVDIHRGDYLLRRQDVVLPGRGLSVDLTFTYRSRSAYNGPYGYGWDMTYNKHLRKLSNGNVMLLPGTNRKDEFVFTAPSTYTAPAGVYQTLVHNADGTWTLTDPHGLKESYDSNGNLTKIEDRNGNALAFSYDPGGLFSIKGISAFFVTLLTGVIAKDYQLQRITDTIGRTITFTYNAEGRLATISYEGRTIQYGYDSSGSGDLLTVTMPSTPDVPVGATTTYAYTTHNLTTITDPKNQAHLANVYDPTFDCLTQQTFGSGTSMITYANSPTCPTTAEASTPGYSLKLTPLTATPGNALTVNWTAPAGSSFSDTVALYQQGAPTTSYLSYFNTGGTATGSGTFTIPSGGSAGLYEARYVPGQNFSAPTTATSNSVTVSPSPLPVTVDVTDRKGFLTRYTFDPAGHITNLEQFTDGIPAGEPASYVTQYEYDANGNRTRILFPRGNAIEMTYDGKGNLTEIRRKKIGAAKGVPTPDDLVTAFTYESTYNFLKTIKDPNGNTTTYTYDYELGEPNKGNLRKITFPTVNSVTPQTVFTYNAFGQVDTVTDPNTNVTKYAYDPTSGYLTSITQGFGKPEAATTGLGYDTVGNVTSLTNANGKITSFQYNARNQLEKVTAPAPFAFETRYRYDANGNLAQVDRQAKTAAPGAQPSLGTTSPTDDWQSTVYAYTALDQLQSVTDDLSHTTHFTYDKNGNRDSLTDAKGQTTTYVYEERDRLETTTDAATPAGITTDLYDPNGNLTTLTDAKSQPTTYAYDDFDRLTTTTYANGSHEDYGYDPNSNLTSRLTPANQTLQYTYDALNRLSTKTVPVTGTVTYTYDVGSRLASVLNPQGTLSFTYDALNRVLSTTDYGLRTINYAYDAVGNRKTLTYPDGTLLTSTYDALNRLEKLVEQGGGSFVAKFAYDALSRRTKLTRFNSVESQATYDATNRLLELKHLLLPIKFVWHQPRTWRSALASLLSLHPSPSTLHLAETAEAAPPTVIARPVPLSPQELSTVTYTYDNLGNRLSQTLTPPTPGNTQTYGYDPLSQLQTVTGSQTHGYQYDPVGNRQLVDGTPYTPNPLNQYASVGGTTYQYDPNGNLTNDGTNTYTFDAENRLTSATGPGLSATYTYDAFGRRISKTVNGTTTKFTWDGDQLLEELDGTGNQTAEYLNGPGIDEPLRMQRGTTKSYFLADGLSSVTHLTNPQGAIVESYQYDAYGKPTILNAQGQPITTSAYGNRLLFTGREYDQEAGLYYYRHRTYSWFLGRFLQRDPLGYFDGPNPYTYVRNNPVNYTDPKGESVWIAAVLAAITYLGYQFYLKYSDAAKKYKQLLEAQKDYWSDPTSEPKYRQYGKAFCEFGGAAVQTGASVPGTSISGPPPTSGLDVILNALQEFFINLFSN